MKNICIYTTPEKLLHKQGKLEDDTDKSPNGIYFWRLNTIPKECDNIEKIYFATKGYIRGYFIIDSVDYNLGCEINFYASTWTDIDPTPTTHFQGFKYLGDL